MCATVRPYLRTWEVGWGNVPLAVFGYGGSVIATRVSARQARLVRGRGPWFICTDDPYIDGLLATIHYSRALGLKCESLLHSAFTKIAVVAGLHARSVTTAQSSESVEIWVNG